MYTTDDIITSLTKRGLIPVSQNTFTTTDLVRFMDEELTNAIVPGLMTVRENYFVSTYDQSIVAGQDTYVLAPRCVGRKLKSLYFIDPSGRIARIYQREIDDLPEIYDPNATGTDPFAFYFMDDSIKLVSPPGSSTGTLRQVYFLKRNTLTLSVNCGQVTAIDTPNKIITVNNAPTTFTSSATYDIVKGTPGFTHLGMDLVCTGVSGAALTFSAALPTTLVIGDWLCLAGQSPIAQIPSELHPILSQRTLVTVLNGLNDLNGAAKAEGKLKEMEQSALSQFKVRAEDQSKKAVSANNLSNFVWNRNGRW